MKYFYPAICSYDRKKGMFFVMFPDLIGCEAKASTMNEAAKKAEKLWPPLFWNWKRKRSPFRAQLANGSFVSAKAASESVHSW